MFSWLSCRYTRADHFGSWGRPFEYNAQLYRSLNRAEEARDSVSLLCPAPLYGMPVVLLRLQLHQLCCPQHLPLTNLQARIALRMPWWSLASGFEMVKSIAGLSGDAEAVRQQLDESNITTNLPRGVDVATKTDEQVRFSSQSVACGVCGDVHDVSACQDMQCWH